MCDALTRQKGDLGNRMFQNDMGMRGSKGLGFADTSAGHWNSFFFVPDQEL